MRRIVFIAIVELFFFSCMGVAKDLVFAPTTTLKAETSNNTSAANGFAVQSNGNAGAGNVSKLDLHSLLYPGSRTRIYAHLVGWFGGTNHMNVGYSSTDPVQIRRQIEDMISRGIEGAMIDWYGQDTTSDKAALQIIKEAEAHPGFTVMIMIDKGMLQASTCSGCSRQQALVQQLQYVEHTYFVSSAYARLDGRPVITNFDIEPSYSVDWQAARSSLASGPVFLFQHDTGFSHVLSSGSYSWVMPSTSDLGMGYLKQFYKAGKSHPGLQTVGAVYKGFNDTLASWGGSRVMGQDCGQTWLRTFSMINGMYDSGNQLDALQITTWNDYEEGTEIESGIDNCVSVSASMSASELRWHATGQENTIDHYKIYVSNNGQDLMPLTDMEVGVGRTDMCSFALPQASYKLFVQAIGQPGMKNHMSSAVTYTPACGGNMPGVTLQAKPSLLNITMGGSGNTTISVSSKSAALDLPVNLTCSGLPVGMDCLFSPDSVNTKTGQPSSTLVVSTVAIASSLHSQGTKMHLFSACVLPLGAIAILGINGPIRKRFFRGLALAVIVGGIVLLSSCGGTGRSQLRTGASYTISVVGVCGSNQMSTTVTVRVE